MEGIIPKKLAVTKEGVYVGLRPQAFIDLRKQPMSTYTFTPSSAYALSTHEVIITKDRIRVKLTSSGQFVYDQDYTNGIAFRCAGNNFEIGTLNASHVFIKQVDMGSRKAGLWVEEVNNANRFIGSNDTTNSGIFNIYNLNQCPVLLAKASADITEIKCPCQGTPCTNGCYQYGE